MGVDGVKLQYIKKDVKEYIGTLPEKELEDLEKEIHGQYTCQNKAEIMHEIELEKKERILMQYVSTTTSDFLRSEFPNALNDVNERKINQSLQYYRSINVNPDTLVKWCPIALDIEACFKIYDNMHAHGSTDFEIIRALTQNYDNIRKAEQSWTTNNNSTIEEFNEFIKNSEERLKQSKAGTESYDKYVKRMMNQNKEIMRKLA